ncbi:hypothetical protein [Formosa haliotis]|uniref:hypothetical protein n=1 Tax=Formosa haliotis TaxID=1555194 RepID=UPI0009F443D2|nr:hypothetical protein [Formosa haliotis]
MKPIFLIFVTLFSCTIMAQKQVDKIIDAQNISTIYINGANCFKIHVVASQSNEIQLQTKIEGEHNEDMVVVSKTSRDTLYIATIFHPSFIADNDKLSAHKLMSIELELSIPEQLNLYAKSDIASFWAEGRFNTAVIELNQGNCNLKNFLGSATVNTVNGSIFVETNYVLVQALSKHGSVNLGPLVPGESHIDLTSIHGNIKVIKSE